MHGQTRDNRVQEVSEISQGLKKFGEGIKDSGVGIGSIVSGDGNQGRKAQIVGFKRIRKY